MDHIHHKIFRPNHKWKWSKLLAVKLEKIMRFLKFKIYGDADADPDFILSVRYHFMVYKMTNWDEVTQRRDNPSCCAEINGLIGLVIKMKVVWRGMSPYTCRVLTADEYQHIIGKLCNGDIMVGAFLCASFAF